LSTGKAAGKVQGFVSAVKSRKAGKRADVRYAMLLAAYSHRQNIEKTGFEIRKR
jgi:hypothetical protein